MARQKLPRYIVVLNIIMIVLILIICGLSFSLAYSELKPKEETSSNVSDTDEASAESAQSSELEEQTSVTTTTTRITVSMTKRSTDEAEYVPPIVIEDTTETKTDDDENESKESEESVVSYKKYSKKFFEDDLFIGDSISTGLYLYGKLDGKNVAASVGYTPYKAYSTAIELYDGTTRTALEYAQDMQPKRIFVMLGSNGMTSDGDISVMQNTYKTLIDKLSAACPNSEIYCLSVTPVTKDSTAAASGGITNDIIKSFNDYIDNLCSESDIQYLDVYTLLCDSDGFFSAEFAEMDGLHFLGSTYDTMLSYIQTKLS